MPVIPKINGRIESVIGGGASPPGGVSRIIIIKALAKKIAPIKPEKNFAAMNLFILLCAYNGEAHRRGAANAAPVR